MNEPSQQPLAPSTPQEQRRKISSKRSSFNTNLNKAALVSKSQLISKSQNITKSMESVADNSASIQDINAIQLFKNVVPNFVSKHIQLSCAKNFVEKTDIVSMEKQGYAAVVMADVSGYSSLSSVLAERGPVGAQLLGRTMKGYLDKIIGCITSHGGDIVKFAGDAVIVYWKAEVDDLEDVTEQMKGELVVKASYCSMDLLNNLGTYDINIQNCATKVLRLHLGIGAGTIYDVNVGGPPGRWEHFIAGDALKQLSVVLDLAKAGQLAMSHSALKVFSLVIDIDTLNIGDYDKRCIIIPHIGLDKAKRKFPKIASKANLIENDGGLEEQRIQMNQLYINDSALYKLQADINQCRLFQLPADLGSLLDLQELRQVTTIFIKLGPALGKWEAGSVTAAQEVMNTLQKYLKKYEGSLRQVHVDDKGAVALAFFGLPPLAHPDDSSRAINAVLEILKEFKVFLEDFAIGVSTGVVSIGGVGVGDRSEYAVMGDSINMAARMMCNPGAHDSVVCDEKTYNLCRNYFKFDILGEAKVKGKSYPIKIFRPVEMLAEPAKKVKPKNIGTIGRGKEKKLIIDGLTSFSRQETDIIIIEGNGGMGLSCLTQFTRQNASKYDCHICFGSGNEMEKLTPYYLFQEILRDVLNIIENATYNVAGVLTPAVPPEFVEDEAEEIDRSKNLESRIKAALVKIGEIPEKTRLFEFMENFSPVSEETPELEEAISLPDFEAILKKVIKIISLSCKLVLVVSDAQWIDTLSWDFMLDLAKTCPSLGIMIFTKPEKAYDNEDNISKLRYFRRLGRSHFSKLEGISRDDTRELVLSTWPGSPIKKVSPTIVENIYGRSQGNPLYIKSLVNALNDSGQWRIDDDTLNTQSGEFDFETVLVGSDLQSIIVAQFDRLDRKFQLLLKVCSALGATCAMADVFHFFIEVPGFLEDFGFPNAGKVQRKLKSYDKAGYLDLRMYKKRGVERLTIKFKSAVVRQCIYTMMAENHRQQLQLKIAQFYENMLTPHTISRLIIPIYEHYCETSPKYLEKRLFYHQQVAHLHFTRKSHTEAVKLYRSLIQEVSKNAESANPLSFSVYDRACWYQELGEAHQAKGEILEARNCFHECLNLLSCEMPTQKSQLMKVLKKEQATHSKLSIPGSFNESSVLELSETEWAIHLKGKNPSNSVVAVPASIRQKFSQHRLSNFGENPAVNNEGSSPKSTRKLPPLPTKFFQLPGNSEKPEGQQRMNTSGNSLFSLDYQPNANVETEDFQLDDKSKLDAVLRCTLASLAQVYLENDQIVECKYTVLKAINLSENFPKDSKYSRLISKCGYLMWLQESKKASSFKYFDYADKLDNKSDLTCSTGVLMDVARCQFLVNSWDQVLLRCDIVHQMTKNITERCIREESLRLKALVLFQIGPQYASMKASRELYNSSLQEESWIGMFWGTYINLLNISTTLVQERDFREANETMAELWVQAPVDYKSSKQLRILSIAVEIAMTIRTNKADSLATANYWTELEGLMKFVEPHHMETALGLLHVISSLRPELFNSKEKIKKYKTIVKFLIAANNALKQMKCFKLSQPIRYLYKGLISLLTTTRKEALVKWKKGLTCPEVEPTMLFLQGLFHERIGTFTDDSDDAVKHCLEAQNHLFKVGATWMVERLSNSEKS